MKTPLFQIAAEVIRSASRERPADAALRAVLQSKRELMPRDKTEVARAVFTYYRWRGWLHRKQPMEVRLEQALDFAERFQSNPFTLPADALQAKAVPEWVCNEVDCTPEWLRSLQREPRLWLRARPGKAKELAAKLGDCKLARIPGLPEAIEYSGPADLFQSPEFHAGEFEIQDLSSQAVGAICAPQPGETWWDACAGEGGKTLHLSDLMQNKGLIWVSDRSERRLHTLKIRAGRAKVFNYRAAPWEGGPKLPTKTKFDGVLVDAPCSGTGTWGRNPHARWTSTHADVLELAAVQKSLLEHAAGAVKPGGKLVYSVCTLTRSETTEVADGFEPHHPEFSPCPVPDPFAAAPAPLARHWFWPHKVPGNGMFVAVWKRLP